MPGRNPTVLLAALVGIAEAVAVVALGSTRADGLGRPLRRGTYRHTRPVVT